MRFGDRLNWDSPTLWRRRNFDYHKSLREQGFSYRDPLIRYFGREVFHDGEIRITTLELERRQVVLSLRNVYAVDQVVTELMRRRIRTTRVEKRDFITQVRLEDVAHFSVSWKQRAGLMEYQCAELGKLNGLNTLQIRCRSAKGQIGIIKAVFRKPLIEDIAPRLLKYVSGSKAREILGLRKSEWDEAFHMLQGTIP